ncbi:hypothetical protein MJO29_002789, partial [Puccinia striiformis f. sp. tritici]
SQEVFISTTSSKESPDHKNVQNRTLEEETELLTKDLSTMIEVLQLVDPNDDPDYSQNHTPDDNNGKNHPKSIIKSPTDPTITGARKMPVPVKCYGLQLVSKFNASESESRKVLIWLGLWRLRGIGNDGCGTNLVLTFNLPNLPSSSHHAHFQQSVEFTNIIFQQATRSLQIVDWSLFA